MVTFLPAVFVTWRLVKILIQCNTENIRLILLIQTLFFFSCMSCQMVRQRLTHLQTLKISHLHVAGRCAGVREGSTWAAGDQAGFLTASKRVLHAHIWAPEYSPEKLFHH